MTSMRLNNSNDIVANSVRLVSGSGGLVDVGNVLSYTPTLADLILKADKSTSYLKTEIDGFLNGKANTGVSYTIAQSDANYLLKADKSNSYLKAEIDGFLNLSLIHI